jgi:hypothetical protein
MVRGEMRTNTFISTMNASAPEWAQAKYFKPTFGPSQLSRFAADGLIRTSSVKRPGQTRGVRLFHVGDVQALIRNGIEGG